MSTAARRFSLRVLLSGLTLRSAGARALLLAVACFCAVSAWAQGPYTLTVNTTADSNDSTNNCGGSVSTGSVCSLRDAITQANSDNDGDTIVFQSGLTGTIEIGSDGDAAALPPITASMTIQGSGALHLTVSGANTYQVLSVYSGATVSISGLTIVNGKGADGGGIENNGTLMVTSSTFSGNSASNGGAIYTTGSSTLTVTNSTFFGNSASVRGGGIFNKGTLTVTNSTFNGNSASAQGGGILNDPNAMLTANNNIFSGNSAGGGSDTGGGIYNYSGATANASYNVYYKNLAGGSEDDCASCRTNSNAVSATSNPLTLPLGWYGGATQTFLPQPGSAAICAGSASLAAYAGLSFDQRGETMGPSWSCDAGAEVDAGAVQSNYIQVTNNTDAGSGYSDCTSAGTTTCTLRDAIALADFGSGGGDIDFAPSALPNINLGSGLIITGNGVNIIGPGANALTVNGGGPSSSFNVFIVTPAATATLYGLTVSNGNAATAEGGGGIFNGGTLTLLSSTVSGNNGAIAPGAGGILNGGTLTLLSSTVSGNTTSNTGLFAGGIFNTTGATVTIADSTISGNTTSEEGGGIENWGTMTITESTISGNTVTGSTPTEASPAAFGGGIENFNGTLTMTASTVSGNSITCNSGDNCALGNSGGGGIANIDGTLILSNSIVEGNMASGNNASNADIDNINLVTSEGTITYNGGNIVNTSSSTATVNPGLSALQYNGTGATVQTMIPLPNSPAICAGKTSLVPGSITTDERGFPLTTPGYCTSGQIDSGAVQTNYTGLTFAVQPTNTLVNTAISPAPAVEITETNTSTGATDTVAGVPIPLEYSGGSAEMATPANLAATTASTTIDGKTVNAATYSLTPNTTGSGFTLAIGPSGEGIAVSSSSVLTGPAGNSFDVYGVLADIQLSVSPSPVTAGGSVIIAATAVDANGNVVPNNNDTVLLTTWLGPVPVQLTNGVGSISIPAPTAAGGSYTVSGLDETEISVSVLPASFTVTPGALSSVTVTGYPASVIVGVAATGTVVLLDVYGNVLTGTSGTGTVVTSENATPIPVTITNGVGSFSTSFATAASSQSITASFGGISGEQQNITVAPVPGFVVTSTGDSDSGVAGNCPANAAANSPAGNCTLRDALAAAASAGAANIYFSSATFATAQTITLSHGTLTIPSNTTIYGATTGSGATLANLVTVSGGGASTVFTVNSGVTAAAISNLNVVKGSGSISGGGILNSGTLTITGSAVSGNTAADIGGGISNSGTLTVTGSTVSGNTAASNGGGILNNGTLTITGSTVSGNTTAAGDGGGLLIDGGAATVTNSTFSGNSAVGDVGGLFIAGGTLTMANSIVAGNSAGSEYADILGKYTNNGGNQVGTSTTGTSNLAPGLAALGNYGGPTQTLIPLPGSPAICAGAAANIPSGVTTDQRGEPRTNTTYPGYSTTACVDAGSVQTGYSLAFVQQPTNVVQNATMSPTPTVQLDEQGVPFVASSVTVPLTLTSSPTGATLTGGSASTSTSTGAATYSGLSINQVSTGDVLTATLALNAATPPLSLTATSSTFNVLSALTATQAIATETLTDGTAASFTPVTGAGGTGTLTYSISPALPAGLSFNTATGAITGTPTTTLTATTFTVTVKDTNNQTATANFSLTVNAAVTATTAVASTTLTQNHAAASFIPVTGSGGTGTLTYAITAGTLPTGLSFNTATGTISGTPTVTLTATTFTVTVTDANGATATATFSLTISSAIAATTAVASTTLTQNHEATSFIPVTGSGGTGTLSYSITAGTLPTGLSFNTATGTISGTPTVTLTATTFTVTVTDANGVTATANFILTVNPAVAATTEVAATTLTTNQTATPFTPVTGSGGTPALTYSITTGTLPTGLSFNTSTGAITGTPTAAMTATQYTVTVTDANGATATANFSLTVQGMAPTASSVTAVTSPYGATTGIVVTATESGTAGAVTGGVVTFGVTGNAGGSFNPATCTLTSSGACTTTYTPSGTLAAGTYTGAITVSFGAVGSYLAASANNTLTISAIAPAAATINSVSTSYGSTTGIVVTATESGSGGPVTGGIVTFGVAGNLGGSFNPTTCTLSASGTCTTTYTPSGTLAAGTYASDLTASFAAVGNYAAASAASTLSIGDTTQTITFTPATPVTYGVGPITLTAKGGASGNPVTFTLNSGPATLSGSILSVTGAGAISITANQAGNANYSAATAVTATILVNKATPAISLASNVSTVLVENPVTLTATVSSTVSVPTGSVTFLDGTTPLGMVQLTTGVAALTTSFTVVGPHSITAVYSGDNNFVTLTSSATSVLAADFNLAFSGLSSQTILPGGTASYSLTLSPLGTTTFPSAVALSVTGPPAGATYSFSPDPTIASGAGASNVTLTITVPQQKAMLHQPTKLLPVSLATLLLLPFASTMRRRARKLSRLCALLLLLIGGAVGMTTLTGCGADNGFLAQPQQGYSITVTATGGALTHSTTVTLTVE